MVIDDQVNILERLTVARISRVVSWLSNTDSRTVVGFEFEDPHDMRIIRRDVMYCPER